MMMMTFRMLSARLNRVVACGFYSYLRICRFFFTGLLLHCYMVLLRHPLILLLGVVNGV